MKELTTKEQYEYFNDTFNKFNTTLLNQSDDDIEYIIFEDIIDNVVSFLHNMKIKQSKIRRLDFQDFWTH